MWPLKCYELHKYCLYICWPALSGGMALCNISGYIGHRNLELPHLPASLFILGQEIGTQHENMKHFSIQVDCTMMFSTKKLVASIY